MMTEDRAKATKNQMDKKLNIIVKDTCHLCPYCHYELDYYDYYYECNHPAVPSDDIIACDQQMIEWDKTEPSPMTIPSWCPLENADA